MPTMFKTAFELMAINGYRVVVRQMQHYKEDIKEKKDLELGLGWWGCLFEGEWSIWDIVFHERNYTLQGVAETRRAYDAL